MLIIISATFMPKALCINERILDLSKIMPSAAFTTVLSLESFCQVFAARYSDILTGCKSDSFPCSSQQKELNSNPEYPRMCAYKLVTVKFKWWGLQTKVENFIHEVSDIFGIRIQLYWHYTCINTG